ncbi:hypothetical protein NC652_032060 [Populus alba x Populus x berolinensis]|nr:hypothetical protein NC652_032030 [Populus alba x Populus x berolinensis]KAJ6885245.1 hypothetical protein NC652_032057 [Populus alba x Populus x berolinensis]KAJ6885249.1 hypothetical protein NC652_032060 [Populus alba x Populus x berolinensis]
MIYTSLTLLHRFLESSTLLLMVLLLSFTAGTGGHGGAAEDFADVTLVHNADEKEEARELDEMLLEYGGQLTYRYINGGHGGGMGVAAGRRSETLLLVLPQTAELEVVELAAVA